MKHASEDVTPSRVLLKTDRAKAGTDVPLASRDRALVRLAIAGGAALAVVGLTDLALLWVPPNFGVAEWEFATVSATFESLPLAILGLGLLAAGFILRRGRAGLYLVGGLFVFLALLVLGATMLFALDIPLALRGAPEALQRQLKQHFLKTAVLALAYFSLFSYLAWLTFASARAQRKSA